MTATNIISPLGKKVSTESGQNFSAVIFIYDSKTEERVMATGFDFERTDPGLSWKFANVAKAIAGKMKTARKVVDA
jgi:hypothetical protein